MQIFRVLLDIMSLGIVQMGAFLLYKDIFLVVIRFGEQLNLNG